MPKLKQHFFVCTNARPPFAQPSCGPEAGNQLLARLREEIDARGLTDEIKITKCGCLGPCEKGPLMVVYPEATWYAQVQLLDIPEIVETHVVAGRPVERLVYNWEEKSTDC
jgi:(2Fe-2S) ferredoxin